MDRELLESYKSLLVQLVPENEQLPARTTSKPCLTRSRSAALGIGLIVGVFVIVSPLPVGDAEQTEWIWEVGLLGVWGVLGAIVASRICFLIGFYRRAKELNHGSSKAEHYKILLQHSKEPIPYSPICIVLMTSMGALSSLYLLQQYGWDPVLFGTVGGPIVLFFCELVAESFIFDLLPHYNLFCDALDATGKKSVLMGESADFPTEDEHKRSGKFK